MTSGNLEEISGNAAPPDAFSTAPSVRSAPCPVVGLGASAGGLEAFQNFLVAAPVDAGFAYVLVQHLDPNHESMLAELLSRRTPDAGTPDQRRHGRSSPTTSI